jgi:hypothetical protein
MATTHVMGVGTADETVIGIGIGGSTLTGSIETGEIAMTTTTMMMIVDEDGREGFGLLEAISATFSTFDDFAVTVTSA